MVEVLRLCYGLDVPHVRGLHPDQCYGCRREGDPAWADLLRPSDGEQAHEQESRDCC